MSDNIYRDSFRRSPTRSSILDPDLEFRVNKILSKIPGQSKSRHYDSHSHLTSYTPSNPRRSYSPLQSSYSSYEKDRRIPNYPSTATSSYFPDKYGDSHLKKSLFTAPSYLNPELRGRREKSPVQE